MINKNNSDQNNDKETAELSGKSFLGDNLLSWSQSIRNGYIRSYIIFALHETNVFKLLKEKPNLTVDQIAKECDLNSKLLNGILNFLIHADEIMVKKENVYINLT